MSDVLQHMTEHSERTPWNLITTSYVRHPRIITDANVYHSPAIGSINIASTIKRTLKLAFEVGHADSVYKLF